MQRRGFGGRQNVAGMLKLRQALGRLAEAGRQRALKRQPGTADAESCTPVFGLSANETQPRRPWRLDQERLTKQSRRVGKMGIFPAHGLQQPSAFALAEVNVQERQRHPDLAPFHCRNFGSSTIWSMPHARKLGRTRITLVFPKRDHQCGIRQGNSPKPFLLSGTLLALTPFVDPCPDTEFDNVWRVAERLVRLSYVQSIEEWTKHKHCMAEDLNIARNTVWSRGLAG
jgi:hypothetical protein